MSLSLIRRSPARWGLVLGLAAALFVASIVAFTAPASAAGIAAPFVDTATAPMAPSGEGGSGVNNAEAPTWIAFAVLLAPFAVLITASLYMIFRWDHFEGNA